MASKPRTGVDRLFYTTDEVSTMTGSSTSTLYDWRMSGTGPLALKIGKHLRYPVADFHRWLDHRIAEEKQRRASKSNRPMSDVLS